MALVSWCGPSTWVEALIVAPAQSGGGEGSSDSSGDLLSDVGDEIEVTLDRWSVGQLGISDLVAAAVVVVTGIVIGWLLGRLVRRSTRQLSGGPGAAAGTIGQLVVAGANMVAAAVALEILGFGLGPILVLALIAIVAVLLLRPMLTNLSSGLLLQLRSALELGDLVSVADDVLGTVRAITARTVVIDTPDGRRVHVPNSIVLDRAIVNYTTIGSRKSSFAIMVSADEDLEQVIETVRSALGTTGAVHIEPVPTVRVAGLVGGFATIRVELWHDWPRSAARTTVDEAIRAVVRDLRSIGIPLGGPTVLDITASADGADT